MNGESCAFTHLTANLNFSPLGLHKLLDQCQSDTHSLYLLWDEMSACQKRSKTKGSFSSLIPIPVSKTSSTMSPFRRAALSCTIPPAGVNFSALNSRFSKIFSNLSLSVTTVPRL